MRFLDQYLQMESVNSHLAEIELLDSILPKEYLT